MNRFWAILLCLLSLASPGVAQRDLKDIPGAFAKRSPMRYEAVSTVIMQYRWFKLPLLGVISVDTKGGNFALAGMSQLGLKVFEVRRQNGKLETQIPEPLLKRSPKIGSAIADDVHRMFLELTPAPNASVRLVGTLAVYSQKSSGGVLEYRFDTLSGNLVEKRFSRRAGLTPWSNTPWLVTYSSYAPLGDALYPRTVSLKNRAMHYQITEVVKEMRLRKESR